MILDSFNIPKEACVIEQKLLTPQQLWEEKHRLGDLVPNKYPDYNDERKQQ